MKILITIESNPISGTTVKVEADDQAPVLVQSAIPKKPATIKQQVDSKPPPPPSTPNEDKPTEPPKADPDCGYCRRRGTPCARHGGKRTGYVKVEDRSPEAHWCRKCRAYTTHDTDNHPAPEKVVVLSQPKPLNPDPDFMPGYEKSAEELATWNPKPKLPGTDEYAGATRDDREADRRPKK